MRSLEEKLVEDGVRPLFMTGEDGVAYLLQVRARLCTIIIVGRTAPECLLVELDLFDVRTAIDHRP